MNDSECVAFLQWALPQLRMRWRGFRKVRRQVCRRLGRRLEELQLPDLDAYRRILERDPKEWSSVDAACRITISRFYRDRRVYDTLKEAVFPFLAAEAVARGARELRCLSIGCASGEEPYALSMLWRLELARRFPKLRLRIDALDVDPRMLERARRAAYSSGSLKELPEGWREVAFEKAGAEFLLKGCFREDVHFERGDVRHGLPNHHYSLVLCRNLVFTYYHKPLQEEILARLEQHMKPGGVLIVGGRESLPEDDIRFVPWSGAKGIYRLALLISQKGSESICAPCLRLRPNAQIV
jgi:chemotaxis protein methyltransferase CheR